MESRLRSLSAKKSGSAPYIPERGDLVTVTLDPRVGHEQAGRRPALVLSPSAYNQRSGLAIMSPITNQAKGYPFEVTLPAGCGVTGVVLADHCKSQDYEARRAVLVGRAPEGTTSAVLGLLARLLDG